MSELFYRLIHERIPEVCGKSQSFRNSPVRVFLIQSHFMNMDSVFPEIIFNSETSVYRYSVSDAPVCCTDNTCLAVGAGFEASFIAYKFVGLAVSGVVV